MCTRARMILSGMDTQSVKEEVIAKEKLSDTEMMKIEYRQAMLSGRVDLLESYLAKYNRKKSGNQSRKSTVYGLYLEK